MLLIPRLANQSIMIGDDIEVKISRIDGMTVCLAIQAPREIYISRKEVYKKVKSIMNNNKYTEIE